MNVEINSLMDKLNRIDSTKEKEEVKRLEETIRRQQNKLNSLSKSINNYGENKQLTFGLNATKSVNESSFDVNVID